MYCRLGHDNIPMSLRLDISNMCMCMCVKVGFKTSQSQFKGGHSLLAKPDTCCAHKGRRIK